MLSTEIPPDLSCPFEISQLKSSNSNIRIDEKVSDVNQHQLEVDLLKPDFVDDNPLPKFSIRDYISTTRCKDIRINWPFSQKNLQLCLKHGLRDVLPPFQSVNAVRNPSRMKCLVGNTNDNKARLSNLSNDLLSGYSNNVAEQQALKVDNISFTESEKDKDFPLPKSCSCSNTSFILNTKQHLEVPVSMNLPNSIVERPGSSVPVKNSLGKNIKMIVKLHKVAAQGINEHLAGNSSGISEIMTSIVCPVCMTFSSSSNTTLNAHIDQCLSGVSAIELASSSKASKHRIKPRKTKSMVNIYATAKCCTLEDLDRRNGTNWSLNFGLPSQDMKVCAEDKKIDSVGCKNEKAAVYVDSSGTKFRSLSKFRDLPSNLNAEYDCGHRELAQRNTENKFSSSKKGKILVKKHKLLKHPHDRLLCSSRPNYCPEDNYYQNRKPVQNEGHEEAYVARPVKACNPLTSDEMGMVKQRAGSKRTHMKKTNLECVKHIPDKIVRKLRVKSSISERGNSGIKFTSDSSDENPSPLPFKSFKRRKSEECNEEESMIKRDELSSLKLRDCDGKRSSQSFYQYSVKQSRKDVLSVYACHTDPVNDAEKSDLFHQSKKLEINTTLASNASCSRGNSIVHYKKVVLVAGKDNDVSKRPSLQCTTSSLNKKHSPLRKTSTVMRASVPVLKEERLRKRHFNFQKSKVYSLPDSDEEAVMKQSTLRIKDFEEEKVTENAAQMRNSCGQPSTKRTRVTKIEKRGLVKSGKGLYASSMDTDTSSESCSDGVRKTPDSFTRVGVSKSTSSIPLDIVKGVEIQDEYILKQISEKDEEALIASGKSFDSAIHCFSVPSDGDCDSQHHMKAHDRHCSDKLLSDNESEMFRVDNVFQNVVIPETHEVFQLGIDGRRGNYFVDVDPIPIPGPPGCFLPSPGHMSSEELQGNSSLTTCRISDNKHDLVHMGSPNSPISSASMVSESAAARSDSLQLNLVEQSHGVQRQNLCNGSNVVINPVIESSPSFVQLGCGEPKVNLDESMGSFFTPTMSSQNIRNYQPCCSRNEKDIQNGSLLSRQWSLTSLQFPVQEQPMGSDIIRKTRDFNFCEEILPKKEQVKPVEVNENSSVGGALALVSRDCETNFINTGDCEFPCPSTSIPVLRLMGKDVMVMKKDENLSTGARSLRLSTVCDHPSLMPNVYNSDSTCKSPDDHHFIRCTVSQASPLLHHVKPELRLSNGFSLCPHPAAFMPGKRCGSLNATLEHREYGGKCNFTNEFGYNIGKNTYIAYDIKKHPTYGLGTADFSGFKPKQVYAIDESLETAAGVAIGAENGEAVMDARGSGFGRCASMTLGHDSRNVNPLFSNQYQNFPLYNDGSQTVLTTSFQTSSKEINTSSIKWSCAVPKDSNMIHPNSLIASSPSTGHLGSSIYISPGFS